MFAFIRSLIAKYFVAKHVVPLALMFSTLLIESRALADPQFSIQLHLGWSYSCADFFLSAPNDKKFVLKQSGAIEAEMMTIVKVVVESNGDISPERLKTLRERLSRIETVFHENSALTLDTEITVHRASDTLVYVFFAGKSARIEAEVKGGTFADLLGRKPGVTLELTPDGLQTLGEWEFERIGGRLLGQTADTLQLFVIAIAEFGYPKLSIQDPNELKRDLSLQPGCSTPTGFSILNGTRKFTFEFPLEPIPDDDNCTGVLR
jgi:hypothetical protein